MSEFQFSEDPVDTERKLNAHKTFRRRPGRLKFTSCVQEGVLFGRFYKSSR